MKKINISNLKGKLVTTGLFASYQANKQKILNGLESPKLLFENSRAESVDVSVIIPFRNGIKNLIMCVKSLLNQCTDIVYEVIIVIDDSVDDVETIGKLLAKVNVGHTVVKCERPKFVGELPINRAGPIRNVGAKIANGKRLVFLDSDMVVDTNFIDIHSGFKSDEIAMGLRNDDVRKKFLELKTNLTPWRLLHSHNFSILKSQFIEAGMFSSDYLYWGLEDEELGYRLKDKKMIIDRRLDAVHLDHKLEQSSEVLRRLSDVFQYVLFYERHMDETILESYNFDIKRIHLRVFDKCNNNCIYCEQTNRKGLFLNKEQIQSELKYAKMIGMVVRLDGGELPIHPEFKEIMSMIKVNSYEVELVTNGRIFSIPEMQNKVDGCVQSFLIQVNGWTRSDEITRVPNSHKQFLEGIEALSKIGGVRFNINLLDRNIDDLDKMLAFTGKFGSDVGLSYYPVVGHEKFEYEKFLLNHSRVNKKIKEAYKSVRLRNSFFRCYKGESIEQMNDCLKCEVLSYCGSSPDFIKNIK